MGWVPQLSGSPSDSTCLSKALLRDSADIPVSCWFRGADTEAVSFFCLSCAGRIAARWISRAAGGQEVATFLFQLESGNCSLANSKWGMARAAKGVENSRSEWSHLISRCLACLPGTQFHPTPHPTELRRALGVAAIHGCFLLRVGKVRDCPLTTDKF